MPGRHESHACCGPEQMSEATHRHSHRRLSSSRRSLVQAIRPQSSDRLAYHRSQRASLLPPNDVEVAGVVKAVGPCAWSRGRVAWLVGLAASAVATGRVVFLTLLGDRSEGEEL